MAKESVLKEAIAKLKYNSGVLKEKRTKCSSTKEVAEIDKQLAQNDSMILDYEYRIKQNVESCHQDFPFLQKHSLETC